MPRFVILEHDHPFQHWDLMLESGESLRTWRLSETPYTGCEIDAEELPDHRIDYLDYEGPVSGNRGSVRRWDAGDYGLTMRGDNRLRFTVNSARLNGVAELSRTDGSNWLFRYQT